MGYSESEQFYGLRGKSNLDFFRSLYMALAFSPIILLSNKTFSPTMSHRTTLHEMAAVSKARRVCQGLC